MDGDSKMNKTPARLLLALSLFAAGCGRQNANPNAEAPPPAQVEQEQNGAVVQVDHPEQIALATATARSARSELPVTAVVTPDVARNVPVVSLVSGRVVEIHARLGDTVQKDQLLLKIRSDDISSGYSDYRKAVADEQLASAQLDRAKDLYAHGAISMNDYQIAQDAEQKAKVDLETTGEHLRLLGSDPDKPNIYVEIHAPVAGVITDQEVTDASTVQAFGINPFIISDLSYVWVVCDVYENNLASIRLGDTADIRLNAFPDRVLQGKVSNIGAILDPNLHTAKVRIEVQNPGQNPGENPGMMRVGMFATATFHGQRQETHTVVPATAVLHLHDNDWVFLPTPDRKFQRTQISLGAALPGNMQEVLTGLAPGAQVVRDALTLENTVEQ
jgi:cobalt-zinc-cadmium efflux system membrane fusion protein